MNRNVLTRNSVIVFYHIKPRMSIGFFDFLKSLDFFGFYVILQLKDMGKPHKSLIMYLRRI